MQRGITPKCDASFFVQQAADYCFIKAPISSREAY